MNNIEEHLQAVVTLFSLVNPMVCAMMFANLTAGQSAAQRTLDATRAIAVIALVLVVAALVGARILGLFGVSLDVFSVAGGFVLSFIGFNMLVGSVSSDKPDSATPPKEAASGVAALAPMILFAASPGTITGVITIAAVHSKSDIPLTALVGVGVVLSFTLILLLLISRKAKDAGSKPPGLARNMIGRYMGLIVIAMGFQYALTGYKAFIAG